MNSVSELRLRNQLSELPRLAEWIHACGAQFHLPPAVVRAADLALAEWITNIISYGYEDEADHTIHLRLTMADGATRIEIRDDARAFNPLDHPPVDTSAPLDARPIGGLGIQMMRQLADRVDYRREGGENILLWSKNLGL